MTGTRARLGSMVDRVFGYSSGRVIATCRMVMAGVFFLAIWIDPAQPARASALGYGLMFGYLVAAVILLAVSWNNWWLDHRLAPAALVLDVVAFLAAFFFTETSSSDFTSPFFGFFVYLLLASALRWGWQATLGTGLAVTFLYLDVGIAVAVSEGPFDVYRFGRRVVYMSVLALVMGWFSSQRHAQGLDRFVEPVMADIGGELPLQAALAYAAGHFRARIGVIAWADFEEPDTQVHAMGPVRPPEVLGPGEFDSDAGLGGPVRLFDRRRQRSLVARGGGVASAAAGPEPLAAACGIDEALALPVLASRGRGEVLLAGIDGLGADHVRLGALISREISAAFDRQAGLALASERALARMRDSLARDLHDSVAQSLAGAALRLEGLSAAIRRGEDPDPEIEAVKHSLRVEQRHVRSVISRLREGSGAGHAVEATALLRSLLPPLETYWGAGLRLAAPDAALLIPAGVGHELALIVREAVANAVRHGRASEIALTLSGDDGQLRLTIGDNGTGFPSQTVKPWTINARVRGLGGSLTVRAVDRGACLEIVLPVETPP